jgi:protein-S-isoprenylcysteine O-methyltransferase Ste14
MIKNSYSYILVILQFGLIGAMLLNSTLSNLSSFYVIIIFILGAIIGILALQHNRLGNFNIRPDLKENATLVNTGIYKFIRHPMYTSVILMAFAIFVSTPTLLEGILFILLIVVLLLKATKEEKLWMAHEKRYKEYKRKTKYFIPYIL